VPAVYPGAGQADGRVVGQRAGPSRSRGRAPRSPASSASRVEHRVVRRQRRRQPIHLHRPEPADAEPEAAATDKSATTSPSPTRPRSTGPDRRDVGFPQVVEVAAEGAVGKHEQAGAGAAGRRDDRGDPVQVEIQVAAETARPPPQGEPRSLAIHRHRERAGTVAAELPAERRGQLTGQLGGARPGIRAQAQAGYAARSAASDQTRAAMSTVSPSSAARTARAQANPEASATATPEHHTGSPVCSASPTATRPGSRATSAAPPGAPAAAAVR